MWVDHDQQEGPKYATLADVNEKSVYVKLNGYWHRPARWRGLSSEVSITDDQRAARTLCGDFLPLPLEQTEDDTIPCDCDYCDDEHERISVLKTLQR